MRIDIPIGLQAGGGKGPAQGSRSGSAARWEPLTVPAVGPAEAASGADLGSEAATDEPARYYQRVAAVPDGQGADGEDAPCLLMVSPLLPLPRSLPALIADTLAGEADFRIDWKWPILTPRVGRWELVVQMCVGTSLGSGVTTGRIYVALDAGFGAYLIVCVDRNPRKLAERQKELLALMAGARLYDHRRAPAPGQGAEPRAENDGSAPQNIDVAVSQATTSPEQPVPVPVPVEIPPVGVEVLPPQQPPAELYLKDTLFSYLVD